MGQDDSKKLPARRTGKYSLSRLNARKHGVLARCGLLADDDLRGFRKLLDDLRSEYRPAGRTENDFVEQLAAVMLRSRRLLFIEAAALARAGQMTASSVPDLDEFEKSVLAKALTAPGEHMAIDEAHSTPLRTNVDRGPAKLREVLAHRRGDLTQPAVDVVNGHRSFRRSGHLKFPRSAAVVSVISRRMDRAVPLAVGHVFSGRAAG